MSQIYIILKTMQSVLSHTISLKCFNECKMSIYQYKFYITRLIILTKNDSQRNNKQDDM